jgi:hypothetical protein
MKNKQLRSKLKLNQKVQSILTVSPQVRKYPQSTTVRYLAIKLRRAESLPNKLTIPIIHEMGSEDQ